MKSPDIMRQDSAHENSAIRRFQSSLAKRAPKKDVADANRWHGILRSAKLSKELAMGRHK